MKLLRPSFILETSLSEERERILKAIERAARTCYKSECKATEDSASAFVRKITQVRKHESVIEHASATVRFIIDRGVSHELVRHRLAAFSQESTRYVNYSGEKTGGHCQFIIPPWCPELKEGTFTWEMVQYEGKLRDISARTYTIQDPGTCNWLKAMQTAEDQYRRLSSIGWSPQQARSVLPNSTKTEVVMTANMREWRHVFKMRCSEAAHPQMREVMVPVYKAFKECLPELFDDLSDI